MFSLHLQARIIMLIVNLDSYWWAKHGKSALEELSAESCLQLESLVKGYPKIAVCSSHACMFNMYMQWVVHMSSVSKPARSQGCLDGPDSHSWTLLYNQSPEVFWTMLVSL